MRKEIKTLISTSTRQVGSGVKLVGETGQALARIAAQVDEVDAAVGEIAGSAREQATGLAEVNAAVSKMDQVTQQNAAVVEESTAAARSLAAETEELAGMAGRFRLGPKGGSISAGIGPAHRSVPAARATALRPAKAAPAKLRVVSRTAEGGCPPAACLGWRSPGLARVLRRARPGRSPAGVATSDGRREQLVDRCGSRRAGSEARPTSIYPDPCAVVANWQRAKQRCTR